MDGTTNLKSLCSIDILSECVIGGVENLVNAMSQRVYDDVVYVRGETSEVFQLSYPRLAKNQDCTKNNYESWYKRECEDAPYV